VEDEGLEVDLAAKAELAKVGEGGEEDGCHGGPAVGGVCGVELVVTGVGFGGGDVDLVGEGEVVEVGVREE
jgi:hypothetical protein